MNYLVHGLAPHPEARRQMSLKVPAVIPPQPVAATPPIPVRARRRSLRRVVAALSVRRGRGGPTDRGRWMSADGGVSPIAGGATRGVAFLVDR